LPSQLGGRQALAAWLVCALPIALGFVLPVLFMLRPLGADWHALPWVSFVQWSFNSVWLAGLTAALATAIALILAFAVRHRPHALNRAAVQLVSLGYAVPGAVIVVGLLLPVGWLQAAAPQTSVAYWVTATALGIVWAYLVRFCAVALQSVQSGYARIPASLDDSARMLGTSGWRLLARVHWPLLRRSAVVAGLLVFVDVMKELPATLVLRPFNMDTLAVRAHAYASDERLADAALGGALRRAKPKGAERGGGGSVCGRGRARPGDGARGGRGARMEDYANLEYPLAPRPCRRQCRD
jgi:iron(III) transport system permease protein